jgi:hypothetical protein
MIPSLMSRRRRSRPAVLTIGVRRAAVLLLAVPLVAGIGCDTVPLTAPTGSTITLHVNPASVAANGSADITAVVTESGGTAVQNGTLVSFFSSIGAIQPPQGQTRNGSVTVQFQAGLQTGDAVISATCGAATLAGTATITVLSTATPAVATIVLSANPGTLPAAGGDTKLTALATDANGTAIPGVLVAFTATAGSIATPFVTTDLSGQATTTLTTSVQTTVTATAGVKTATATVSVAATMAVTLAATPATAAVNVPIAFTATVSASGGGTPPAITEYRWTFGDGATATTSGPQTSHAFAASGTKVVTVTAVAASGATAIGRIEIVIS